MGHLIIFYLFYMSMFLYLCMYVSCACYGVYVEIRGQLGEVSSFLYHVHPGAQTPDSKYLYLLSHLPGSLFDSNAINYIDKIPG